MELIDTHCHLDFDVFSQDREDVIRAAGHVGIRCFIVPAVKRATWDDLIHLCSNNEVLRYALGLHPIFISAHEKEHLQALEQYLDNYSPVAVGEIGLDFYDKDLAINMQEDFFERQLCIAKEADLPVILHVRKAHDKVLALLKKIAVVGGIVHAFNGSTQQADVYRSLNFKFGFGGMLTYERSTKLRKLAKELPLESIVLETDSPDMTVAQHQGERNSPVYLPYCLQALAEVKSVSPEEVARQTTQNAKDILNIS